MVGGLQNIPNANFKKLKDLILQNEGKLNSLAAVLSLLKYQNYILFIIQRMGRKITLLMSL